MDTKKERGKIDWMITLVPLAIVIALCVLFFFVPEQSNAVLSRIRFFFGDTFGTYYLVIGLGIFIVSLYIAGSKYGNIVLGEPNEKPKHGCTAQICYLFVVSNRQQRISSGESICFVYKFFNEDNLKWENTLEPMVSVGKPESL